MARRQPNLGFMGGYWVFPGGTVDSMDSNIATYSDTIACREGVSPALYVAAARELFEETGISLAEAAPYCVQPSCEPDEGAECVRPSGSFADLLRERGFDISRLCLWARWITPSASKRRYDTYFFIAEMTSEVEPEPHGEEIDVLEWVYPGRWAQGDPLTHQPIAPPTQLLLRELAEELNVHGSLRSLFEFAGSKKILPVLPKIIRLDPVTVVFPWDLEYESFPGESLPWEPRAQPDRSRWPSRLSMKTTSP